MQKKIIALAIAGALTAPVLAFADPAVSMYGVLDGAIASVSADGTKSQVLAVSGGLSQTRLGAKAVDDLGNGTKVLGVFEYGIDSENPDNLGGTSTIARQKLLGLTGNWGTAATGYLQTTAYDWATKYDPAADSSISALQNITNTNSGTTSGFLIGTLAGAGRAQRALAYISPSFSGFNFAVNYSTALVGTGNVGAPSSAASAPSAWLLSGNYGMGPWSVGLVYAAADNGTCGAVQCNETEWALGGAYDFTVTKLSATYQATKNSVYSGNNKAYSISDVTPAGPGNLLLQYAGSSIDTDMTGGGSLSSASPSSYTVGYLYPLAKSTTAYVAYSALKNGATSRAFSVDNGVVAGDTNMSFGGTSTLVALGVNYKF
ncbi:MAG: porin [Gallionella sp.]